MYELYVYDFCTFKSRKIHWNMYSVYIQATKYLLIYPISSIGPAWFSSMRSGWHSGARITIRRASEALGNPAHGARGYPHWTEEACRLIGNCFANNEG